MKFLAILVLLLAIPVSILTIPLCAHSQATNGSNGRISYFYPLDHAKDISPKTDIAFRYNQIVPQDRLEHCAFIVQGTISGKIDGKILLAADHRTILFKPTRELIPGEVVQCTISFGESHWQSKTIAFTIGELIPNTISVEQSLGISKASEPIPFNTRTDTVPSAFPDIQVTQRDNVADGYIFLGNLSFARQFPSYYMMMIDSNGNPFYKKEIGSRAIDFKVLTTGLLTYFDGFKYIGLDSTATPVTTFAAGHGYATDTHDLLETPDSSYFLIATRVVTKNLSDTSIGGSKHAQVLDNVIQELDKNGNVIFEWFGLDHYKVTDANGVNLRDSGMIDYEHANALDLDSDGNLLLSNRHLDEVTKINVETGDIIWRLGGKHNQFTFINDSVGFSHQHAIRFIGHHHYTLFDNGNLKNPPYSRAVEYQLDEKAKTATLTWQFMHDPPLITTAMGYVQRLPNGNTLIGWGSETRVAATEVHPDGTIAMELLMDSTNISYRAFKFPWQFPTSTSSRVSQHSAPAFKLEPSFPNPASNRLFVSLMIDKPDVVSLNLYDAVGNKVTTIFNGMLSQGEYKFPVATSGLANGSYFCRLQTKEGIQTTGLSIVH